MWSYYSFGKRKVYSKFLVYIPGQGFLSQAYETRAQAIEELEARIGEGDEGHEGYVQAAYFRAPACWRLKSRGWPEVGSYRLEPLPAEKFDNKAAARLARCNVIWE